MSDAPTLNGLRTVNVRLLFPWRGVWIADVELDLDDVTTQLPSGKATLLAGGSTLLGTIDPRGSGSFATRATVRVIGGGNGWDATVKRQHFNRADGNLTTTTIYNATAGQVGESVNDPSPQPFGSDFVRTAGPASRIFQDRDWHVDISGVTQVAPWGAATLDTNATITSFEAIQLRGEVVTDFLLLPGTVLTDDRFNGTSYTVREVEQTFGKNGSHATVWCSTSEDSRLATALANLVTELGGTKYLKSYKYRFVNAADGTHVNLQSIDGNAPDLVPAACWFSPGLSAKLTPSQNVVVSFLFGDARFPVVTGVDPTLPVEVTLDASSRIHIAPSGAPAPAARAGDAIQVILPPTMPVVGIITPPGSAFTGTITITNPAFGVIASGSAKVDVG